MRRFVSLTLGLILVNALHPGVGLNLPLPPATAASGVETAAFNLKDFVSHLVPQSIFEAMSNNEILPIVIFSIFFGVALTSIGERGKPLVRGVESLVGVMLQVTNYVMRFAPFAVFTAVASALAERGPQIIMTLGKFVGSFYLGLAILWAILIGACFVIVGPRTRHLVRYIRDPVVLAFSTASSEAAYPAHARRAGALRSAAAHRQFRPAARLFVQPRRIDDVHDVRVDLHRPGLRHRPQHRPGNHHAAGADDHVQGHGRRARARAWW